MALTSTLQGCSASCRALCARTYATRAIANRCLRMRVNDWHRSAVNLSDSTCYVWHDIRDARHCHPNDYHPQPTCTFRMQQYTCNNNPPSSTTGHHDIRQRTYAATYTRWQPAVLHARASRHPSRYACRDIHGLSVHQLTGPGIAASGKFCISSHASSEQSPALCEPILTQRHMTGPAILPSKPPSYERGLPNQPV